MLKTYYIDCESIRTFEWSTTNKLSYLSKLNDRGLFNWLDAELLEAVQPYSDTKNDVMFNALSIIRIIEPNEGIKISPLIVTNTVLGVVDPREIFMVGVWLLLNHTTSLLALWSGTQIVLFPSIKISVDNGD